MKKLNQNILILWLLSFVLMIATSCSTTSLLAEDEQLYNGVKTFEITPEKGEKVPSDVDTYLFDVINVKPNNSLYSPYLEIKKLMLSLFHLDSLKLS